MEKEDDSDSFRCESCGFCCQLDVVLNEKDIKRIKSFEEKGFIRKRSGDLLLKHKRGFCIFYDYVNKGCLIYEHRPEVCRRFPFREDGVKSSKCKQNKDFHSKVTQNIIRFSNLEKDKDTHNL